jgi:hypothetical protein
MVLLPTQQVLFLKLTFTNRHHTAKEKKKNHFFMELWYRDRPKFLKSDTEKKDIDKIM